MTESIRETLLNKANALPLCPGVYMMKDKSGKVIYVGKSRKLKNRVSQYFQNSEKNVKTARMVSRVADFDYFLCDTEMEALSLENTLIKQYNPHYNIRLKDAKSYPYIKLTDETYPRLVVTRQRNDGKGKYFGPYSGVATAYALVDLLNKTLRLPSCRHTFPKEFGTVRPCLQAHIGRCCGLCRGDISPEEYREQVRQVSALLSGKTKEVKEALTARMTEYAEREQFESAGRVRDTIRALDKIKEKQKVVASPDTDLDAVGYYSDEVAGCLSVYAVRGGILLDKEDFPFGAEEILDAQDVPSFLYRRYQTRGDCPPEILLSFPCEEESLTEIAEGLSAIAGRRVLLHTPVRGEKKQLTDMVLKNAKEQTERYRREADKEEGTLVKLAGILSLEVYPARIESYDISNYGDEHITAGMVVVKEGKFSKSDYRVFRMKTVDGADDYASMREALSRRIAHIGQDESSFSEKPDLILLDGGKGHVGVVRELLTELNVSIPVFGMVKDDYHKTRTLCTDREEISVAREQDLFQFLYRLQEEVHRYTISAMKKAKEKTMKTSSLTKIPGIGDKKAKILLSKLGSLSAVRTANADTLAQVRGISRRDAEAIVAFFAEQTEKKEKDEANHP